MTIPASLDQRMLQSYSESSTTANLPVANVKISDTASGSSAPQFQGNIAHDAVDSGNPVKVGGKATDPTSMPTAVASGDRVNAAYDLSGRAIIYDGMLRGGENLSDDVQGVQLKPISGATYTGTKVQNNSFTTLNLKSGSGNVLSFRCINTTASTRYLQFHNTATTPAGGATAQEKFLVPASSQIVIGPGDIMFDGIYFSTGIAYANSSVATTYTAGAAGDLLLDIIYI